MSCPNSAECQLNMEIMHKTCIRVGLPLEPTKAQGPLLSLTFLGIELDTTMEICLPQDKLSRATEALIHWRCRKANRKRDLLLLIGTLANVSKVIRSNRIFLCRLIDMSMTATKSNHFIRLNAETKSDIEWWFQFMSRWNGTSMLPHLDLQLLSLVTDASGTWGCGAYWDCEWFQLQWSDMFADAHISVKELTPVVLATAICGRTWSGHKVQIMSDDSAAIAAINNMTSRVKESTHLLQFLAFLTVHYQCHLYAIHLPGKHNTRFDALLHNNLKLFRLLHPQAQQKPTQLLSELLRLVIIEQPDWTSPHWTELWT